MTIPLSAVAAVLALVAALLAPSAHAAEAARRTAPNFALLDLQGRHHDLQRSGARAVAVFFTGVGCPIARKSAKPWRELAKRYEAQGIQFWVINTYAGERRSEMFEEAAELGLLRRPYLPDSRQAVALALGVERTAEVVLLEVEHGTVLYQGALDDRFTAEGAERPQPTERYLEAALDEFLAGKTVSRPRTAARGCRITYAPTGEGEVPSYTRTIVPILRDHCVGCHRPGSIGPFALDSHDRARNYAKMMEEVILERRMPPWDPHPDHGEFMDANRLTREETQHLLRWVRAGAPRDGEDDPLAEPLPPVREWTLGTPDLLLRLPQPEKIPATGVLDYRHVELTTLKEDLWLSGLDIKPGNRRVVHHVILYARWPGCPDDGSGQGVFVFGWAPGYTAAHYPPGTARHLPAGATLTAELHYTTSGTEETDQSEIALYFAPGPQPLKVEVRSATELDLDIPPGTDESRHTATYAFKKPARLYSLAPHMHYRGKWMKYELLLPDGTTETLLHVPRYDFKWQFSYVLKTPRDIPAGAWLLVTGAFDNSAGNPANPDPRQRVHFGLQSWDEMFIGFFEAADLPAAPNTASVR